MLNLSKSDCKNWLSVAKRAKIFVNCLFLSIVSSKYKFSLENAPGLVAWFGEISQVNYCFILFLSFVTCQ